MQDDIICELNRSGLGLDLFRFQSAIAQVHFFQLASVSLLGDWVSRRGDIKSSSNGVHLFMVRLHPQCLIDFVYRIADFSKVLLYFLGVRWNGQLGELHRGCWKGGSIPTCFWVGIQFFPSLSPLYSFVASK